MRKSFSRLVLILVLMGAVVPLLSACNTAAGAGQDVSAAGRAVTRGANEVRQGL